MTTEEFIKKVVIGEIKLPPRPVIVPETREAAQNGEPTCGAYHNQWVCTLPRGHGTHHIAYAGRTVFCDGWDDEVL